MVFSFFCLILLIYYIENYTNSTKLKIYKYDSNNAIRQNKLINKLWHKFVQNKLETSYLR
jgi:hypothetical protein